MTHFPVAVIVPKLLTTYSAIESYIANKIEIYSAHNEVETYEVECYCVRSARREIIAKIALKHLGEVTSATPRENLDPAYKIASTIMSESLMLAFSAGYAYGQGYLPSTNSKRNAFKDIEEWLNNEIVEGFPLVTDDLIDEFLMLELALSSVRNYRDIVYKSVFSAFDTLISYIDLKVVDANPSCESCKGTGLEDSNSNPVGHWDYWQIGRNYSLAWADASSLLVEQNPDLYKLHGHILKTEDFISDDVAPPLAIVDLDGTWHQEGEIGWFASMSNTNLNWEQDARKIFEANKDAYAVILDVHI